MKVKIKGNEIELNGTEVSILYWTLRDYYTEIDIKDRYNCSDDDAYEACKIVNQKLERSDRFWEEYWDSIDEAAKELGLVEEEEKF